MTSKVEENITSINGNDSTITTTPNEEADVKKTATFKQLFSEADSYDILLMTAGTIAALGTGAAFPFFNVLFGDMMDALNSNPNGFADSIADIAKKFCYVAIAQFFTCAVQVTCWSIAGERQTQKLRLKYVKSILRQEIGWYDINNPSTLSTRVADLSGSLQDGITSRAAELFQFGGQFTGSYIVGLYLCWKLALVLVCALPLIAGSGAFMVLSITNAQNTVGENYAQAGGLATESLSAIRTVSALNMQADVISKYRVYLHKAMSMGIAKGFNVGLGNAGTFTAFFLTYSLGFWFGGKLVADDMDGGCFLKSDTSACMTGGKVLATFFSIVMGSFALGQIAPPLAAFTAAKASVAPMMEVIERTPEIDGLSATGTIPTSPATGNIQLKDVFFSYPSRPHIKTCNGFNLDIKSGETVALVGASGCGKSTIINLLLRFYDPQSGQILLDGHSLADLNLRWLRGTCGYVGQEPCLFSGSIFDNIAYGLDSVLLEQGMCERNEELKQKVIAAAKKANCHGFISNFPQGYDTDVGSNGVQMSGGQKQRIAIARALVKKPAVLLLDEATSALDATSEKLVQESIDALQKEKNQTTIVIAHRLSTIRNADKIAVVSEGRVVELGTHDDLIAKKGAYYDLVQLQVNDAPIEQSSSTSDLTSLVSNPSAVEAAIETKEVVKVEDNTKVEEIVPDKKANDKVWRLVMKHKGWLFCALCGGAGFGAVFPILGLLLSMALKSFYQPTSNDVREQVAWVAIYYIICAGGAAVSGVLLYYGSAQLSERISMRLRSTLFEAILRREISFFDKEENAIGNLTNRLSNDSRVVSKASGELLAKTLQAIFTLIIGLIIGLIAAWKLALVVLATFPINAISGIIQQQMQMGLGRTKDTANDDGKEGGIISSAFNNMRTVSAFSMHIKVLEEYEAKTYSDSVKRQWNSARVGAAVGLANGSLFCTYAFLFWYGGTLIEAKEITYENMMKALFCIMFGAMGMGSALADVGDQKQGLLAANRIFQAVEDAEQSPIDGLSLTGSRLSKRSEGKIEFRNVIFAYPSRPDALTCNGLNLTINKGEVVALVGPSGSGKSTVMALLLRFYDPISGEILLDDTNVKDLNIKQLRSQIGYVGQEPVLFNMSIAENIAKGRAEIDQKLLTVDEAMYNLSQNTSNDSICPCLKTSTPKISNNNKNNYQDVAVAVPVNGDGDIEGGSIHLKGHIDDDIISASKESYAHDFIMKFTKQYDTDVGEGSIMVSGGQKQRIAIARALVKKPAVLLLDEATSALDATSEKLVQESIDELTKHKTQTTIIIAHRLTTIKNADRILVIDKGQVVETGTHDDLLTKDGLYKELWSKQNSH